MLLPLVFKKSLAKYYQKWYEDSLKSADYCFKQGNDTQANEFLRDAERYRVLIVDNFDAIEYFKEGDRAFIKDSALTPEFRGYK